MQPLSLEILWTIFSCVQVSKSDVKYWARVILYKFTLVNKPELNKVCHSLYNFFLGRIQGVKLGGVSENILSNVIYRIRVLQELKNCRNWISLRNHYQVLYDDWLMVMIWCKVLLSLIYYWVEGRGKDGEVKTLLILEYCIFLLDVYPSLYIWKL